MGRNGDSPTPRRGPLFPGDKGGETGIIPPSLSGHPSPRCEDRERAPEEM